MNDEYLIKIHKPRIQEICDTYINIKGEVLDKYLYK